MPLADTLQRSTIGSADATAHEADPTDRSEDEGHWGRRARIPRSSRALPGAPQRRVRLRPNIHQPGGERYYQSYGGPIVEDCRRAGDPAESACEANGSLASFAGEDGSAAGTLESAPWPHGRNISRGSRQHHGVAHRMRASARPIATIS